MCGRELPDRHSICNYRRKCTTQPEPPTCTHTPSYYAVPCTRFLWFFFLTKVCVVSEEYNMLNDWSRKWRTCWCMRVCVCVCACTSWRRMVTMVISYNLLTDWSGQWAASSGFTLLHKRTYVFLHYRASRCQFKAIYCIFSNSPFVG